MMGRRHAQTGVVAFTAFALGLWATDIYTVSVAEYAVGTLVTAAGSVEPDRDHPGSTVARVYGPVTRLQSRILRTAAGGHRVGTHSLVGIFLAGLTAWVIVRFRDWTYDGYEVGQWVLAAYLVLLLGTAAAALGKALPGTGRTEGIVTGALLVAAALTAVGSTVIAALPLHVLPVAVALGWWAHCVGDDITDARVRWFWPITDWEIPLPFTIETNGPFERKVVTPACGVAMAYMAMVALTATWTPWDWTGRAVGEGLIAFSHSTVVPLAIGVSNTALDALSTLPGYLA